MKEWEALLTKAYEDVGGKPDGAFPGHIGGTYFINVPDVAMAMFDLAKKQKNGNE